MFAFHFLALVVQFSSQTGEQSNCWDVLLGTKSQTLATWIYTVVTGVVLVMVYRQVVSMKASGELSAFETFYRLWENEDVRESRRQVYRTFGPAVNNSNPMERQILEEKILGLLSQNEPLLKHVDRLIYTNNLVGALWTEELVPRGFRDKFIGYIYKTAILQWDCLRPYIRMERERRERQPHSITFAKPFERLKDEAEKRLGNEPRPRPTY